MGDKQFGIDNKRLMQYAQDIKEIVDLKVEVGIVIGGGNIFRGVQAEKGGMDRTQGDYMGMLATMINSMALQSALETIGLYTRLQSAIDMKQIAEPYIKRKAVRHLEKGRVVIFGSGTGNPFFTTDTAAALRAIELNAEVVVKATKVEGIFSADPKKVKDAKLFKNITFDEVISKKLKVMDSTAFTLCRDQGMPIAVLSLFKKNALLNFIHGAEEGTLVTLN